MCGILVWYTMMPSLSDHQDAIGHILVILTSSLGMAATGLNTLLLEYCQVLPCSEYQKFYLNRKVHMGHEKRVSITSFSHTTILYSSAQQRISKYIESFYFSTSAQSTKPL